MYRPADDSSGDDSHTIMVCRICLETEGRMERVQGGEYEEAYRQLTGVKWNTSDKLPQHACWECAARLAGAARLRRRALAAHALLLDAVTMYDIQRVDRNFRSLKSNLTTKHFPPNEYLSTTITNNQNCKQDPENNKEIKTDKNNLKTNKTIFDDAKNMEHAKSKETEINIAKADNAQNIITDNNIEIIADINVANKSKDINFEYDSDDSSHCLVIDAEPLETIIKSEYVGNSDGGMSIDELIDIYNNDGDGDGRLQELNERFGEEATVQVDQGWGGRRPASGDLRERDGRRAPVSDNTHNSVKTSMRKLFKEFQMSRAYEKLNHELFTITPVSEQDQIAEIAKRQDTFRFKSAPFKCYLCFRSFQNRRAHDSHMQRHSAKNGAYECSICKARQKSPRAVKTHVYGQHTVKISCNDCGFVTMNRSVARSHEKWHAGTVYQCPHCPMRFDQESTYKSHLRTQHVHAFACALCGFTFVSAKGLAVHRCKRHPAADQIPLLGPYCAACDLKFAMDEAYSRHLRLSSRHRSNNAPAAAPPPPPASSAPDSSQLARGL